MNGTDKSMHLDLDLSFMGKGKKKVLSHSDGINADRQAKDFKIEDYSMAGNVLSIDMARGGGYAAVITGIIQDSL